MKRKIVPGDVVLLRSGGSLMTVGSVDSGQDSVLVIWMEGMLIQQQYLPLSAVRLVEEAEEGT